MNKYLIIGGAGFVGSNLVKMLGKNNCLILDKNPSPFFNDITFIGDIRNKEEIIIPETIETVILLAAEHRDDVSPVKLYYDVNVKGTQNVLEVMHENNLNNLIFTSSVAIYGLNKKNPNEFSDKDPFNHYGKSKWEAEQVINNWFRESQTKRTVNILRPSVIFGERNRGNVYNLLKQITSGKFVMIGPGKNIKSMAYVGNICSFISFLLIHQKKQGISVYNYCDKPEINMNALIKIIEKKIMINIPKIKIPYAIGLLGGYFFDLIALTTGKTLTISSVRIIKFCATTQFDSTKAHNIFKAPYTLSEGLNKTLEFEFMDNNKDNILFFSE
jgi:nucleoside-diphosphate-sugar epimerase